jgi:hypothetical protein
MPGPESNPEALGDRDGLELVQKIPLFRALPPEQRLAIGVR